MWKQPILLSSWTLKVKTSAVFGRARRLQRSTTPLITSAYLQTLVVSLKADFRLRWQRTFMQVIWKKVRNRKTWTVAGNRQAFLFWMIFLFIFICFVPVFLFEDKCMASVLYLNLLGFQSKFIQTCSLRSIWRHSCMIIWFCFSSSTTPVFINIRVPKLLCWNNQTLFKKEIAYWWILRFL